MAFDVSDEEVKICLDELGKEYLRLGEVHCKNLTDGSQLSAFLLIGVRAVSLSYVLPLVLDGGYLDVFDVARRAVLESYYLMNDMRLKDSAGKKVYEWHQGKGNSWSSDSKRWESVVLIEGEPIFGKEYGEFSELAHPTFQATNQSGTTLLHLYGVEEHEAEFQRNVESVRVDIKWLLARLLNATFVQHDDYIKIPLSVLNLPTCTEVIKRFNRHVGELRAQQKADIPDEEGRK